MKLYCSTTLLQKLGYKIDLSPRPQDPLHVWYASSITIDDLELIVAILLPYRFCILLPLVQRGQHSLLSQALVQGIRDALQNYHVSQDLIDQYIPADTVFGMDFIEDKSESIVLTTALRYIHHLEFPDRDLVKLQQQINDTLFVSRAISCVPSLSLIHELELTYAAPAPDADPPADQPADQGEV